MPSADFFNSVLFAGWPHEKLPDVFTAIVVGIPVKHPTNSQDSPSTLAPASVSTPRLGAIETGQPYEPREEIKTKFKVMIDPLHMSYFSLDISVRYKAADGQIRDEKLIAFFTAANLLGEPAWEAITNADEDKIASLATLFDLGHDQVGKYLKEDTLSHITLSIAGGKPLGCNLFVNAEYGSLTSSVHMFRDALRAGPLEIHILTKPDIGDLVEEAWKSIADQSANDPILNWWPMGNVNVQKGRELLPELRPNYTISPRGNFLSETEYFTVMFYGVDAESSLPDEGFKDFTAVNVRFVEIVKLGDRSYFAFIERNDSLPLRPGDHFSLCVDTETDIRGRDWHGQVIDPIPFAPPGDIPCLVNRPWIADGKRGGYYHELDLPDEIVLRRQNEKNCAAILKGLSTMRAGIARLLIASSDQEYSRQKNSLRVLWQRRAEGHGRELLKKLMGNDVMDLPLVDIYGHLEADPVALDNTIAAAKAQLQGEQLRAIDGLRSMPGGIQIVQGAPGTGKTRWLRAALEPLYVFSSDDCPVKALVMAPMNSAVDTLASAIDQDMRRIIGGRRHPIVVRAHSWETEKLLYRLPEEQERKVNAPTQRPSRIQEDELDISDLEGARELLRIYEATTHQPIPGVHDPRVTKIELSIGFHMCAVAGVRRGNNTKHPRADSDNKKWLTFRSELRRFAAGETFEPEEKQKFTDLALSLRNRVLELADVVVCTLSNAVDASILTSFRPNILINEESGKAPEADTIGPLIRYETARATILVGDSRQLPPIVKSDLETTPFAQQQAVSLMSRLALCGYNMYTFTSQHRCDATICDLINVQYKVLTTDPSVSARSSVQWAKTWFAESFGVRTNTVFVNVPDGEAMEYSGRSKANRLNVAVGFYLYSELLASGVHPKDIAIAVPYNGQRFRYLRARDAHREWLAGHNDQILSQAADHINETAILTFDSMQGSEREHVIVDLTVTDKLGFLSLSNRINVALSRARSGLLVVGNDTELQRSHNHKNKAIKNRYKKTAIAKSIDWYKHNRLFFDYQRGWVYKHIWDALKDEIDDNYRQDDPIDIVPRMELKDRLHKAAGEVADLG